MALMAYRSTPVAATGVSPSELIMGRCIRSGVPSHPKTRTPKWPNFEKVRKADEKSKTNMRLHYNNGHGARTLNPVCVRDNVRVKTDKPGNWTESGTVTSADYGGRSYVIDTPRGLLRRNRRHIQRTGYERPDQTDHDLDVQFELLEPSSEQMPAATCNVPTLETGNSNNSNEYIANNNAVPERARESVKESPQVTTRT